MNTLIDGRKRSSTRDAGPMTLWRLEVLRLSRTHRWMILLGVYVLFAVLGALSARFFNELMGRVGGDITIIAPDPRPVDGLIQFVSNAGQMGLLAVVVVAAAALAFDAHPERAAFLRTRMAHPGRLVVAPYVVNMLAAIVSLVIGTAVTVALTAALVGPMPLVPVAIGTLYGALYLAFVVAVVAAAATLVRSQIATVFASLGVLIVLPILGLVDALQPWLPSQLLNAVIAIVEGAAATDYARAALVAIAAIAGLLVLAARRLEVRES